MATLSLARRAALQVLPIWLAGPALPPLPSHAAQALQPAASGFQTRSGLQYIDFREGTGESPRFGQLIRFHYVGYTIEGSSLRVFDSSYERTKPYFTKHGNGLTCQGIEEALHTMAKGGRRSRPSHALRRISLQSFHALGLIRSARSPDQRPSRLRPRRARARRP